MRQQITDLRNKMKQLGIDVYIVSDKDEHLSEYTDAHFCALEEFSGFTGGDGTLAVSLNNAALWTDGRYFIQAEKELAGSEIELMRQGIKGTMPLMQWVRRELPEGGCLGFNGRCVSYIEGFNYKRMLGKDIDVRSALDVCDMVWKDRPEETVNKCWILNEDYSGKSVSIKLIELRETMAKLGAKTHILASLDDIAWLLNLRGSDIACNPVFTAYMIITAQRAVLYSDERHFDKEILDYLEFAGVELKVNNAVYTDAELVEGPVLIDRRHCSYELSNAIPAGSHIIDRINPTAMDKCCKNDTECKNIRIAQHIDSLAVTRYMYWFKTVVNEAIKTPGGSEYTEWTCALKLHELRAANKHFIEESFPTISAYAANAAMAHYMPDALHSVPIEPRGLYLVDSGGQYYEGTTDVTRTWSCGNINDEERKAVTLSVIANLRLAAAKFLEGCASPVLDYAAREPFWRHGMNYNHATGHGVGHVLNVHEGPTGIRYKFTSIEGAYPMLAGMYVSDEPGYYVEGEYGVRTENLLLVQKDYTNEYGSFCSFETCTLVPMDKDCIDISLMNAEDISLYNAYQQRVYEELGPELDEAERAWLKEACAPLA